jgi:hypothetical protein
MIEGDSDEYSLLKKWSSDFNCDGHYSCEIGVRQGMGSKTIMDNVKNNYLHIGVDPYGAINILTMTKILHGLASKKVSHQLIPTV